MDAALHWVCYVCVASLHRSVDAVRIDVRGATRDVPGAGTGLTPVDASCVASLSARSVHSPAQGRDTSSVDPGCCGFAL